MKLLGAAALVAALAFTGVNAASVEPAGTTDVGSQGSGCSYWISNTPSFQGCITSNGNLAVLKIGPVFWFGDSPFFNKEGHALCHADGAYDDLDANGYGWEAPILVSQSASKVVIRRATTDGRFTLTQTWTRKPKERIATVANALKANVAARGVYFVRGAKFAPSFGGGPYFGFIVADWSMHGYWLRLDGYGRENQYPGNAISVTDTNFVGPYAWAGGLDVPGYCRAVHEGPPAPPIQVPDSVGWGFIRFFAGDMAAGQTKTYSVTYRGH